MKARLEEALPSGTDSGQGPERPESSSNTICADFIIFAPTVACFPSSKRQTKSGTNNSHADSDDDDLLGEQEVTIDCSELRPVMRRRGNMTADIKLGHKNYKEKARQSYIKLRRATNNFREMQTFSSFERHHSTPCTPGSQGVSKRTVSNDQSKTATQVDNDM